MKSKFMLVFSMVAAAASASALDERLLTDFVTPALDLQWRVVNDNVMGGRSNGGFRLTGDALRFTGATNTNGGGFSSIRTVPQRLDLSDYTGLRMRVRGDGRTYTMRLSSSERRISYWADLPTLDDRWVEVVIPFDVFWPNWRGRKLDQGPIDPADIRGLGVMIYDGFDGAFALEIDWIKAIKRV
jgi:monofunctional biosynthetic peptidoglycan transglycosylase